MLLNNLIPNETTKYDLRAEQRRSYILGCIRNGAHKCMHETRYFVTAMCMFVVAFIVLLCNDLICNILYEPPFNNIMALLFPFMWLFVVPFLSLVALYLMGTSKNAWEYYRNFVRAGFVNASGEAPILIKSEKALTGSYTFLTFTTRGLPLETWDDQKSTIESALNLIVVNIQYGVDRRTIFLTTLSGDKALPEHIRWDWEYLPKEKHLLALGESLTGAVTVNLNDTPHMLIAGSTGSGKSILVKTILAESLAHGDRVILCDMKGLDFSNFYWQSTEIEIYKDVTAVKNVLNNVAEELRHRAKEAQRFYAEPLNKDKKLPPMQRIIFAVDEVTALTDKTALNKDEKADVDSILRNLTLIATQGRAFNINLILSTQRPDADAIPGKIKNNLDFRICGKCDNTLSLIVLDNANASDRIPKDSHGLFLTNDGTLFKGYYFTDEMLDHPTLLF